METYVALLRAVNLGGDSTVRMDALREVVERIGFEDVRTWLQSGNLVFRGERGGTAALERRLEEQVGRAFAWKPEIFVRTSAEWQTVIEGNPFREAARRDPAHLTVWALRDAPAPSAWAELARDIPGREQVAGGNRAAYIVYPDGIGRSRVTAAWVERRLGTRGTARNWNTVLKLGALSSG
jgi:uncharacterized protein (DUF1697 family)